jgi:hypothetical protein
MCLANNHTLIRVVFIASAGSHACAILVLNYTAAKEHLNFFLATKICAEMSFGQLSII